MLADRSHFRISGRKKATSRVAGKIIPAQGGHGLIDEAEFAQGFSSFGVFGILDQQLVIGSLHIALGRAHGLFNAFDFVAVPLPYLGGVDACHVFTLLKPQACAQDSGLASLKPSEGMRYQCR